MAQETKVLTPKNEAPSQNKGEENITANNSDDLIAQLQADSKKRSTSQKKKKIEEYKATQATREILFSRLGKTVNVPLIMDDESVMVFKVKRLSEAENSDILDRSLAIKSLDEMTAQELEESNNYNYRLLEKVVVDPQLTQDEWRSKVDTALVQRLVEQIMKVLTNIDDTHIFDDFQK
jgi:hypothetical protein